LADAALAREESFKLGLIIQLFPATLTVDGAGFKGFPTRRIVAADVRRL
jgi:hypothetical protein